MFVFCLQLIFAFCKVGFPAVLFVVCFFVAFLWYFFPLDDLHLKKTDHLDWVSTWSEHFNFCLCAVGRQGKHFGGAPPDGAGEH